MNRAPTWLNRNVLFFASDLDLSLIANNDFVVHHHGDAIDDTFQAQLTVHLMAISSMTDAEMHRAEPFFLAAHVERARREFSSPFFLR